VIFLVVFVHSNLTTFGSTIACKHPTQKPFLVHSPLPCFILALPYNAQIIFKVFKYCSIRYIQHAWTRHTILVPPPNELGDVLWCQWKEGILTPTKLKIATSFLGYSIVVGSTIFTRNFLKTWFKQIIDILHPTWGLACIEVECCSS
jgi:hypothetical protein